MAQRFPSLPAAVPSRCLCSFTLCLHLGLDFHPHPACLPPRVLLALQCSASMLPPPGGSSQAVPTQGPPALRTLGSPRHHRRRELPISARGRWLWPARPWAVSLCSALRPPVRVVIPAALPPPRRRGRVLGQKVRCSVAPADLVPLRASCLRAPGKGPRGSGGRQGARTRTEVGDSVPRPGSHAGDLHCSSGAVSRGCLGGGYSAPARFSLVMELTPRRWPVVKPMGSSQSWEFPLGPESTGALGRNVLQTL